MAEDMDLRMRILARADQALRVIKRVNRVVARTARITARIGAVARPAFRILGRAASLALRPLKIMGGVLAGLGVGLLAFGYKALNTAGDIEALKLRIEGVASSAKEAKRVFNTALSVAIASPFEPEEMANAAIGLLNLGMMGRKALISVGNAAALTKPSLDEIVSMLTSLETEPLRRIGVELRRDAGEFEFTFRDKMGKVREITATGIEDARKQLLSIFDVKFGGGMGRFAKAWQGLISTLRGNIRLAIGDFGDGMFPAAKRFIEGLNANIKNWIESGQLKEWGEKVGDYVMKAFDYAAAVIEYAKGVWSSIDGDMGSMADVFGKLLAGGGQILAESLVAYLSAMQGIFTGLGKLIASALYETLLDVPIIGDRMAKASAIREFTSEGYSEAEAKSALKRMDLTKEDLRNRARARAQATSGALFQSGLNDFAASVAGISTGMKSRVAEIMGDTMAGVNVASGYTGPSVEDIARRRQADRAMDLVTGVRRVFVPGRSNEEFGSYRWDRVTSEQPGGKFALGDIAPSGHGIIQVDNLKISADSARELRNKLIQRVARPAMAAAGT